MTPATGTQDGTPPSSGRLTGRAGFVGPSEWAASGQTSGLRELLWQRLRGIAVIILGLAIAFGIRILAIPAFQSRLSTSDKTAWVLATVFLGVLVAGLWRDLGLTLAQLRRIEALLFGIGLLFGAFLTVRWLGRGVSVPSLVTPAQHTQLAGSFWALSGDGGVYVPLGFQALQGFVVLRWCLFAVLYGVVIPNTWRRCAVMMAALIVVGVASILVGAWQTPALFRQVGLLLMQAVPVMAAFAGIGIYGCHKISDLQKQVSVARQIGQYHLVRRLGGGGMGEVYLARHRMLRRPCAVKLIRADQSDNRSVVARFEREVQAMAQLTHPNTVEIFDYGRTDDGMFYYVMEFLAGISLETLVRRHGALPPGRIVYLLQQVCRALAEAHAAGLIHRDIKPGNVFVCERGGEHDRVKLLDFGLVKVAGVAEAPEPQAAPDAAAGGDVQLTQHGHILGTPAYMSPEQVQGRDVDLRSDIYSLGAVAYYLLTGQPPFPRATASEMYRAHASEAPRPPSERRAGIPADLEQVVLRCLSKDPAERYADVRQLELALGLCRCAGDWDESQAAAWWRDGAGAADGADADPLSSSDDSGDDRAATVGAISSAAALQL